MINNPLTILHLSDIHFSITEAKSDSAKRTEILNEFRKSIINNMEKGLIPDYVVISGDLTFSANIDEFDIAEFFLMELKNDIVLKNPAFTLENFIIAPGNHDKERNSIDISVDDLIRNMNPRKCNKKTLGMLFNDTSLVDKKNGFSTQFKNYNHFYNRLFINDRKSGDYTNLLFHKEDKGIVFVTINTALACINSKIDCGRLLLNKDSVVELFTKVEEIRKNDKDIIVCTVMHHNPGWLNWEEKFDAFAPFEKLISLSDIVFTGHEHCTKSAPDYLSNKSQLIYGGATFEGTKDLWNCYSFVKIDLKKFYFQIHSYLFDPRKAGKKYDILSDPAKRFYFRHNPNGNIPKQIELEFLLDTLYKGRIKKKIDKLLTK